jgi:cell division protein FtsB
VPPRASKDSAGRVLFRRLAWGAGALAVLAYTIEGGEYGTSDLLRQRTQRAALEDSLAALRDVVDSLRQELALATTDDARLERVAREEFGMVKGEKELIYWTPGERVRRRGAAADSMVRQTP